MPLPARRRVCAQTWTKTARKVELEWLDYWERNGPGSATYIFYVRAIDPAGNTDVTFRIGGTENINYYKWRYTQRPPIMIITLSSCTFVMLVTGSWLEYRRRKRKRAMERYAIKRMRRKFKSAQKEMTKKGDVDWRDMMDEGGKKKKKKKGGKDKDKDGKKKKKKDKDGKKKDKEGKKKDKKKKDKEGGSSKEKDKDKAKRSKKE